jgi:hypothetical protein
MSETENHVKCLVEQNSLKTSDGVIIKVYELQHDENDQILSAWAKHFRNHYCSDDEIDYLREGTGLSRSDYLLSMKFPDQIADFGPATRAGDFGEILISDYLEYILDYWVPRTRYDRKNIRNESTKGSDVLAFKFVNESESVNDILAIFEVKTQLSRGNNNNRLQDAINDSIKDNIRKAESLNAVKQRLFDKGNLEDAKKISRFQNPVDNPYKEISGAAALFSNDVYFEDLIVLANGQNHPNKNNLSLVIIRGELFMKLVHDLYLRAANEA